MKQDSNAILTLCSHLCVGEGVHPLEPQEYSNLAQRLQQAGKTPKDLFAFISEDFSSILGCDLDQTERLKRLLDRDASLSFELGEYQNMGIEVITRADAQYPRLLKKKLSHGCPSFPNYTSTATGFCASWLWAAPANTLRRVADFAPTEL